jgi:hypothetical protein
MSTPLIQDELEITPEMIKAGRAALDEWRNEIIPRHPEHQDIRLVRSLFAAMYRAHLSDQSPAQIA